MNNEKKQLDEQFLPRHTEYIRNMSQKTGRTYRELESEWKKSERQFDFDRMRDPLKYQNLKRTDGTVAQEISRRFEKMVVMPEQTAEEQIEETETEMVEDGLALDIEENLVDETEIDADAEFNDLVDADEETATLEDQLDEKSEMTDIEAEEETLDEDGPSEGVPNKSLEQQRKMEREEPPTTPGEVNEKEP